MFVPAVLGTGKVALVEDNMGFNVSKAVVDKYLERNIFHMPATKCNIFLSAIRSYCILTNKI